MTTDIIEGEAVEVIEPIRAVVVQQPGQALISADTDDGPLRMVTRASALASALKDIVERQRLYAVISGKKYPQVEAWATIGRMDNVVAMEDGNPVRHDDGSYEATVQLIRLSDGMVIGRASALCGMPDDKPWASRAEYARRSMAVTRATSRAFRQQYSWIMALAGYEPTPADEMPQPNAPEPARHDGPTIVDGGVLGTVTAGTASPVDMQLRQSPDGSLYGFKLASGRIGYQCVAVGDLADALSVSGLAKGDEATVWGTVEKVPWEKKQPDGTFKPMPPYSRIVIERVQTADWTVPAVSVAPAGADAAQDAELDALPW